MLKRFIILIGLLLIISSAAAQDTAEWTALIYESNDGTITEIDPNGSILREISLPTEIGLSVHGLAVATSLDGSTIAYTLANNASGNVTESKINLYDANSQQIVASYTLTDGADINSFNQASLKLRTRRDGGAFATGYGYFVGDELLWEVVSLSPNLDPQILTRETAASFGLELPDFTYPFILDYAGNEIIFALVPFEGALPEYPAYTWNIVAEQVFQVANTSLPSMISMSGAQLSLDFDASLPPMPEAPQIGYAELYNAIIIKDNGETQTIYQDTEHVLLPAQFVENDQKIAFYTANSDYKFTRHIIDLAGNVLHTADMPDGTPPIFGTPGGFLILDFRANEVPKLKHILTTDNSFAEREIWEGEIAKSYSVLVLTS